MPVVYVQRSTHEDTAESVYCDIDDRYETMETNSPPTVHTREDKPLCEVTSDPPLVPLAPLKNDPTVSSGPGCPLLKHSKQYIISNTEPLYGCKK